MASQLAGIGARIDDWRYCPYHPEHRAERFAEFAGWRKPPPGMLLDLMARWPVPPEDPFLIGDRDRDVAAPPPAGIPCDLSPRGARDAFDARLLARPPADPRPSDRTGPPLR